MLTINCLIHFIIFNLDFNFNLILTMVDSIQIHHHFRYLIRLEVIESPLPSQNLHLKYSQVLELITNFHPIQIRHPTIYFPIPLMFILTFFQFLPVFPRLFLSKSLKLLLINFRYFLLILIFRLLFHFKPLNHLPINFRYFVFILNFPLF